MLPTWRLRKNPDRGETLTKEGNGSNMILLKPDVSDLVTREDAGKLIRATKHWSARIRAESAAALGALRAGDAIPDLIRLLKDSQTEVREAAARALGDIDAKEAVDPLIEALG